MTRLLIVLVAVAMIAAAALMYFLLPQPDDGQITLGISPYQDTAIPVIAQTNGIYDEREVNVDLRTIEWENIVPSLATRGETIDVAIGSINTFLPRANAVNTGQDDPVIFVAPLYVFKGASLVANKDSGIRPYREILTEENGDKDRALRVFVNQLDGARIGYPSGTPYEQLFIEATKGADRTVEEFRPTDVQIADALPALLSGNLELAAAGVTQRTEALRDGHYVAIETEDLGFAEVVGLMTTKSFYESHSEEIEQIRLAWFDSIQLLESQPEVATTGILDYLERNASTRYTFEEYLDSLSAQEFPSTAAAADDMFGNQAARFYWRTTWDIVNDYLLATEAIDEKVPYSYYHSR